MLGAITLLSAVAAAAMALPAPAPARAHAVAHSQRLAARARRGDRAARASLVEQHMGLVRSIAFRYRDLGLPADDLVQEGAIGLLTAIDEYDPERGASFSTYAFWRIRAAVTHAVTARGSIVRVPRPVRERRRSVGAAHDRLSTEGGRATLRRLADATGLPADAVAEALAPITRSLARRSARGRWLCLARTRTRSRRQRRSPVSRRCAGDGAAPASPGQAGDPETALRDRRRSRDAARDRRRHAPEPRAHTGPQGRSASRARCGARRRLSSARLPQFVPLGCGKPPNPATPDGRRTEPRRRFAMATTTHATRLEAGRRIFTRILVGISGSQEALEAARQAALLQDVNGQLTLISAWDIQPVLGGTGSEVPYYYDEELQRTAAEKALTAARDYVEPYTAATTKLVRGTPAPALLEEIERDEDTLVAVGRSKVGRLLGVVEGSVTSQMIHRAPCSILVARPARDGFPRRIAVGVDGSVESAAAYAAARYLAERFDAELRTIVAQSGKDVNERLVDAITDGEHEERWLPPVEALVAAAEDADLVVVGSRGLHGLRSLGSVSERVAHDAGCSVVVARMPVWQRVAEELGR